MTTEPLVRLRGVTCSFGDAPVLVDVDLDVGDGEFVGVVGPSGSGKTTLLKTLLGVERPISGTVERRTGLGVGYVPQVETVDWSFPVTVSECVLMARTASGRPALLLMDEPTSGVDVATRHEFLHLLGDLNRAGLAILLTTHDLNGMAAHTPGRLLEHRGDRRRASSGGAHRRRARAHLRGPNGRA